MIERAFYISDLKIINELKSFIRKSAPSTIFNHSQNEFLIYLTIDANDYYKLSDFINIKNKEYNTNKSIKKQKMKRLPLIIAVIFGLFLSAIYVTCFGWVFWVLGAEEPFGKFNRFLNSVVFDK